MLYRGEAGPLGDCFEGEVGADEIRFDLRYPDVRDHCSGRLAESVSEKTVKRTPGDGEFRGDVVGGEPVACVAANDLEGPAMTAASLHLIAVPIA